MISIKRRSKKTDRLRKVLHYLLAMILLIPILANGGTASAASGWSLIDGGGANGLNVNPANRGEYPGTAVWNGEVYVAWQERIVPGAFSNQIRVKKYNGTSWISVDGNGPNGLNVNAAKAGTRPTMVVFDNALYIAWTEAVTSSLNQVRVKKFNGTSWISAEGGSLAGINADASKDAFGPSLAVYKNALYATWTEAGQVRAKKYDGAEWTSVDGGGATGLNVNPLRVAGFPIMSVLGNDLYLVFSEVSGTNYQIRVKKYDGISWTIIDGSTTGLNMVSSKSATYPSVVVVDNALYVAWDEPIGNTDNQVRVKKYDGTTWSSIDGGGMNGINVNPNFRGHHVELAVVNNELYAVWQEHTGTGSFFKVRVKKYDGTTWRSAEANWNGVNVNATKSSFFPAVAVLNNVLYVAWQEKNNTEEQVRVGRYTAPLPPAINSVSVSPGTASVMQGGGKQLAASVDAVGGAATTVTWSSSDASNKVSVGGSGIVRVAADAAPGNYTITATSTVDSSKKGNATITVTLAPAVNSVNISPSSASVMQGGGKQLTASVDAVGGAATTVTWSSSDASNKVSVGGSGIVRVAADAAQGDYTITATSTVDSSKKGTATITVTAAPIAPAVNSVSVSPASASVVQGDNTQLSATVDAVGGAATTVTWSSSDASNKVSVDGSGNVSVGADAAPGNYTITATSTVDSSKKGSATITVTAAPIAPAVNSVSVSPASASVVQGGNTQLSATVDAVGGAATTVTWSSSDASNKVSVDGLGNVTVGADAALGNYIITATSTVDSSKKGSATITVTAAPIAPAVNSVIVSPASENVAQGGNTQLSATVDAVGGAATTVTWSSSDASNKVSVDGLGNVTVGADAALGNYIITATSTVDSSKKGSATITVTASPIAPAVNSVSVSPASENVVQGGDTQLSATVDAVGGAATTVTWSSSDASNKVSVDGSGIVTVATDAAPGAYTITATSTVDSSKKGSATITVTATPITPAVNSVSVSPASENVVQGGDTQLSATVDAVGGAATTVSWSSSDASNKVSVDGSGIVTVATDAALGAYTITATSTVDSSKKGSATITATASPIAPAVNSVSVSPASASVVQGDNTQLSATVDAVGGAATTVTWSSSDASNKVSVDGSGIVTVATDAAPGAYTITATSTVDSTKKGSATITVTAAPIAPAVNSVIVSPTSENVVQGGNMQLSATVDAVGGAATTVTWSSSDASNKVSVDGLGNVTIAVDAVPGNYTITATSTVDISKKGNATITVTAAPIAPTYTIAALTNQMLTVLTQGYVSGTQDTKTIAITNTGTGTLTNLSVKLSGVNSNDFVITQPASDLNSMESTSFTIQAKDGLKAGTYTVTATVSADHMTPVTFNVTQSVNLPNAPANPQNLAAVGGNRQVTLNWDAVPGATYYNIYKATASGEYSEVEVATVTSPTYSIQNLINGATYYFVVKAGNEGGLGAISNMASATPATAPVAPTNVTAIAADGQATITFKAPTENGGSTITGYEVTIAPGNKVATGPSSPIVITGLSNGTSYTFTVKAINAAGISVSSSESNSVVPRSSASEGSSTPSTSPLATNNGVDVLINGKVEQAGTATTSKRNDQHVRTISVNQKKLEEKLAAEGQGTVVTIPFNTKSDVMIGELSGQMVKSMESKQAVIAIKTDQVTYTIPAQQIDIGAVVDKLGKSVTLQDINVQIEIAAPTEDTLKVVENAAVNGTFTLVVPPLDFTIRAIYGNTSVKVTKFNAYVERSIAIPAGIDPNKITTGVVVESDGTVRHVPTKIVILDGKYYAQINSLTNSTYTVVWHPLEFTDVVNHWAKVAINDMGSRMVIDGTGEGLFSPDRDITRGEFASILVRGLGLKLENGSTQFSDVKTSGWFSSAINTAYAYQLIRGFEDDTFRPNDKITREEAMTILSRAMTITGLKAKLSDLSSDAILRPFADVTNVSDWAYSDVADSVQAGLVAGRSADELAPKTYITRAEVATIIQRLLQESDLI